MYFTQVYVMLCFNVVRAAYAMLIATRLPKDTDVSFITELIEVIYSGFSTKKKLGVFWVRFFSISRRVKIKTEKLKQILQYLTTGLLKYSLWE